MGIWADKGWSRFVDYRPENKLLPDNTKPLPEPMLTQGYWHPSQYNFTKIAQDILVKNKF